MFDVLALYAINSLEITFGKAALEIVQPLFLVGARMTIGGLLLLLYVYFFKRSHFKINLKDWSLFLQVIIFAVYIGFVFDFWGMKHMTSSKNALIFTMSPFITAIIAYFMHIETFTWKKTIGLIIGFCGALPVLINNKTQEAEYINQGWFILPELASLCAVAAIAYGWIMLGKLNRERGYISHMINGVTMFAGGLLALCTSFFVDTWHPAPFTAFWPFVGYTAMLILVSNIIVYNWYVTLLQKYSATFISFVSFTQPLYVSLYSWIWLGETVTWNFFASVFVVIIGLFVFYQEELHKKCIIE